MGKLNEITCNTRFARREAAKTKKDHKGT